MLMPNSYLKKISRYGPGGRFCSCCGPAPSKRKQHDRLVKRREKQIAKINIQEEIN